MEKKDAFVSLPSLPVLDFENMGRKRVNGEKEDTRKQEKRGKWDGNDTEV